MGALLHNCFGLVEGTVRPTVRPGMEQQMLYKGQKQSTAWNARQVLSHMAYCIANLHGLVGTLYKIRSQMT